MAPVLAPLITSGNRPCSKRALTTPRWKKPSVAPPDSSNLWLGKMVGEDTDTTRADEVLGVIVHRDLPRLSQAAQDRVALAHADLSQAMALLYRQGVAAGEFRELPPSLAGRLIHEVTMAGGNTVIAAADPTASVDEVAEITAEFLVRALATG